MPCCTGYVALLVVRSDLIFWRCRTAGSGPSSGAGAIPGSGAGAGEREVASGEGRIIIVYNTVQYARACNLLHVATDCTVRTCMI